MTRTRQAVQWVGALAWVPLTLAFERVTTTLAVPGAFIATGFLLGLADRFLMRMEARGRKC